jgi:hypothetical protein
MCEHALHTTATTDGDTNSEQLRSEQYIVSAVAMARAYKTKQQQQQHQQQQKVSIDSIVHISSGICLYK